MHRWKCNVFNRVPMSWIIMYERWNGERFSVHIDIELSAITMNINTKKNNQQSFSLSSVKLISSSKPSNWFSELSKSTWVVQRQNASLTLQLNRIHVRNDNWQSLFTKKIDIHLYTKIYISIYSKQEKECCPMSIATPKFCLSKLFSKTNFESTTHNWNWS